MKQTRPHLQISPLGLVNKYGSKYPKTSQKPESSKYPKTSQKPESHRAYGTTVSRVDIQLN